MVRFIKRTFLSGLAVILPLAFSVYVVYWLAALAEQTIGKLLAAVLPEALSVPGLGLAAGLLSVILVGLIMHLWLVRVIFGWFEAIIERAPLLKTLYGSIRDLMTFAVGSRSQASMKKPVMVSLGAVDATLIGFVTREEFSGLPEGVGSEDSLAVYLPMSYQIGGFTVIVPKSAVREVDMGIEDAMRFAVTAGVSRKKKSALVTPSPEPGAEEAS